MTPPVSPLGFGVSGPHATSLVPARQTVRLIRQAFDQGVTVFDSASFYGGGEAERRLGAAIHDGLPRGSILLSSKVGTHKDGGKLTKDFTPEGVAQGVEQSLANLRTEHLDVVFLHGPPPWMITDALLTRLDALRSSGAVRGIGVCGRGPDVDDVLAMFDFDAVMAPANMDLPPEQRAQHTRWKAAGKLVFGIEVLAPARLGWRTPRSPADLWALVRAIKARGARPAPRRSIETCLDWALGDDGPDVAMIMTTRPQHLAANTARASAKLDAGAAAP